MSIVIRQIQITNFYRDKNGVLLAQAGDVLNNDPDSQAMQVIQSPGIASIPVAPNPSTNQAFNGTIIQGVGKRDLFIGGYDPRSTSIYGDLSAGETCVYAPGSQARMLLKNTGSINLYTTKGNTSDGQGFGIFIDASSDTITLTTSEGSAIQLMGKTISLITPEGCSITLKDLVNIFGKNGFQADGSQVVLGAGPVVPGVNNATMGPSGIVAVANPKVFLGN